MKVIISSTNPVKINAVKKAFNKGFKKSSFKGVKVKSGVPEQPIGESQIRYGAYNRATRALKSGNGDMGVGLEGGVVETEVGMLATAWCCIVDTKGQVSHGGGMYFHLPDIVAGKIRKGGELGPIMDDILHEENWKEKGGAIEIFSNGILNRTDAYTRLVELAMCKFVAKKYYLI